MKNMVKLFEAMRSIAIIALVAVIGGKDAAVTKQNRRFWRSMQSILLCLLTAGTLLVSTACDDDYYGPGGGLTINNLPSGSYEVTVLPITADTSTYISAWAAVLKDALADSTQNGNSFQLWRYYASDSTWTGSGSYKVFLRGSEYGNYWCATVNFTNGNATVNFSSFIKIPLV